MVSLSPWGEDVWLVFWGDENGDGERGTDGILVHELVTGEAKDDEIVGVFFFDFFVERFETFELGGEATFGGGVYDEDNFVFEGRKRVGFAFLC